MKRSDLPVSSVKELMPRFFLMWLNAPELAGVVRPGQFLMVGCGEDTVLRRPLSVHMVDGDRLALLFAVRGKGTEWLSHRRRGQKLDVVGPLGNGFEIPRHAKNLLAVAGGSGIASLCYAAANALTAGKRVMLLVGADTQSHVYPVDMLPRGIEVQVATEDGSQGHKGMVTELVPRRAASADLIIACGPLPMYCRMAAEKKELGIERKPVQVSLEMRMGCGVGVCYGCTVRTKSGLKQVCKDGPVFALDDIVWDEMAVC